MSEIDSKKNNIINLLLDIQEKNGYLPRGEMIALSKRTGIPGVDLYGVATFYAQFKLNKQGKYIIHLCRGTACHVKGSTKFLDYFYELLNLKPGQTTKDEKFTLQCVNCLGACAKAPAMMINDITYGELDKKK
ncbi:MAG: NAD(P)H-dependent oxidoreductase subunit E [bacterium]